MFPLPSLFEPLPTPEEMRAWDAAAGRLGLPPSLLMENAAREAWGALCEVFPPKPGAAILVVMGGGNNGGDGAALARRLREAGGRVLVLCSKPLNTLRGAAAEHAAAAGACGVSFLPAGEHAVPREWDAPDIVIDALTGTGIKGDLREAELALVRLMNEQRARGAFVFSLDIPSGLCGYTGKPRPEAVRANAVVTFEAGKPGLFFPEARPYTGRIVVRPIGIPAEARAAAPPSWVLLNPKFGSWAGPSPLRHKGDAGRVLIVGGSAGMAGAPVLAGLGALRAGAGLVHLACPGGLSLAAPPELMLHAVGNGTAWEPGMTAELLDLAARLRPDILLIGPGLGRSEGSREAARGVLSLPRRPAAVLDADALSFFHLPDVRPEAEAFRQAHSLPLELLRDDDILTPHPGEMAGLLPCSFFSGPDGKALDDPLTRKACVMELQDDRGGALRAFTRQSPAVLVLKGPGTLVGRRGAPAALCPIASPALAVGGSGDVLAGVIAALRTGGLPAREAACLGVHLHARAGQILEARAPLGHLASEIAAAVPAALAELCLPTR